MRAFLLLFFVSLCGVVGFGSARAQTPISPAPTPTVIVVPIPSPPPPGAGTICGPPTYAGGRTVSPLVPGGGTFQIALPGGNFVINGGISDPGGQFVRVCYVEGNSVVFFNLQGRETSRIVNNPSASSVLDEVARGVRIVPAGTPILVTNICGGTARSARASESVRVGSPLGVVAITLPATGAYQFSVPGEIHGDGQGISVCDVATNSTVLLTWGEGQEIGRIVTGSAGGPALDRIVAGVQFQPAPPAPLAPFVPSIPPTFRPPDTGDAGLVW